jgi:Protein of unknown function (DUF1091)
MIIARVLFILSILTMVDGVRDNGNFKEGVRFRGIECKADNISAIFKYCFLKPISRRHVALNIKFDIIKPVKRNIFLQVIINYRCGTVYRQVINTNRIDFCALMQGVIDNVLLKSVIVQIGEQGQNLFHKCPYSGSFELNNFTQASTEIGQPTLFPSGYYRYDITLFVNDKETICVKLATEIKSTIKDTFG